MCPSLGAPTVFVRHLVLVILKQVDRLSTINCLQDYTEMHGQRNIKCIIITALVREVVLNFTRTKQITCSYDLENIFTT